MKFLFSSKFLVVEAMAVSKNSTAYIIAFKYRYFYVLDASNLQVISFAYIPGVFYESKCRLPIFSENS